MIIIKFSLFLLLMTIAAVLVFTALLFIAPVALVVTIGLALGKQDYTY